MRRERHQGNRFPPPGQSASSSSIRREIFESQVAFATARGGSYADDLSGPIRSTGRTSRFRSGIKTAREPAANG